MADRSHPVTVTGYPYPNSSSIYPYTAPVPPNYYPPPPHATLQRRLCAAILSAFLMTAAILFVLYVIIRPQSPIFISHSLSITNFLLPQSLLSATFVFNFSVTNPNGKLTSSYDHIQGSVYYHDESISTTFLVPFVQGSKNVTSLVANFASLDSYVENKEAEEMRNEKMKGSVEFDVRMIARVKYRARWWRPRPRFLRVYCKGLRVVFFGNGKDGEMKGGPKECRVEL